MTVDKCANFCGLDYKYFGVEYASECFCGNEYAASTASPGECSFPCAGNPSQTCGAGNRINIYNNLRYSPRVPGSVEGKLYQGCFVDNGNPRVLPSNLLGSDILTAESECSFPCAGNDRELCGAGGRINVYGPVPPSVGDFLYQGCFTDNNDDRVLSGKVVLDGAMTVELCESSCAGYSWFGVEYGSQCYCGTFLKSSAQKRIESECSMVCGGDSIEKCGTANHLNVYSTGVSQQPDNLLTVGDFSYLSCYTDSGGARSLTGGAPSPAI
ncbi:WSC domain containing protein [Rhypophila sp. PSN 637]